MPFMADEVLDSVCGSRKYTLSEGVVASQRCRAIAHALGGSWTADRVGSCLWVCAMTAVYNIDIDLTSISIPIPSIAATATAAGNVVKSGSKAKTKAKIEVKSESKPSVKPSAKAKAKAKTKGKSKADTVPILEVKLEPEDGSCRREE